MKPATHGTSTMPHGAAPEGKRALRRLVTRTDLIRSAREILSVKGLYEAHVEEITERAGIAKGTLYKYFESKEALVRDVVAAGFDELGLHLERRTPGAAGLQETAARIAEAHDEFLSNNPDLMRIFHQVRGLLKFHREEWKTLRDVLSEHIDRLAAMLARARGAPSPRACRELAILVFGAVSGTLSVRVSIDSAGRGRAAPTLGRCVAAMAAEFVRQEGAGRRGRPT